MPSCVSAFVTSASGSRKTPQVLRLLSGSTDQSSIDRGDNRVGGADGGVQLDRQVGMKGRTRPVWPTLAKRASGDGWQEPINIDSHKPPAMRR